MAFDSIGNLFAAETVVPDNIEIGRVLKFNLRNHVSTVGSAAKFFFAGLAIDIAGNAYVLATDDTSPTAAGTIFKFTPGGERIIFGSVPGVPDPQVVNLGLAFDSAGNLYATASSAQTIYKFAPDGARTVFVDPSQLRASILLGLLSTAAAICSFPSKRLAAREPIRLSISIRWA